MKTDKDVHIIETPTPNLFICVDFGHGGDVTVKTVFEKTPKGIKVISTEVIGRTVDFNEEERERLLEELSNFKMENENDTTDKALCKFSEFIKSYDKAVSEHLNKLNSIQKEHTNQLKGIEEMMRRSSDYAEKHNKGDKYIFFRLELAYTQGWIDCKKFIKENNEEVK